jgi:hypothetical protein
MPFWGVGSGKERERLVVKLISNITVIGPRYVAKRRNDVDERYSKMQRSFGS